jgi:hypothetical protein
MLMRRGPSFFFPDAVRFKSSSARNARMSPSLIVSIGIVAKLDGRMWAESNLL